MIIALPLTAILSLAPPPNIDMADVVSRTSGVCRLAQISTPTTSAAPAPATAANRNEIYHFGMAACVPGPGTCDIAMRVSIPAPEPRIGYIEAELELEATDLIRLVAVDSSQRSDCSRWHLKKPLLSASSAAWLNARSELVVVDSRQNGLFFIPLGGNTAAAKLEMEIDFLPATVTALENGGYWVTDVDYQVKVFDHLFRRVGSINLKQGRNGTANGLESLYDWTIAGSTIYGYGYVKAGSLDGSLGFFRATINKDGFIESPFKLVDSTNYEFYVLGHPYVAKTSRYVFFLEMTERPAIHRFARSGSLNATKLKAFPREFSKIIEINTRGSGSKQTEDVFAKVERSKIPVGLYGVGNFLYLLARAPADGGTAWWLYQIDPERDQITGTLRLPTSAHHLSIVTTRDEWVLIEKGKVKTMGIQDINNIVTIPSEWILNPAGSPLKQKESTAYLCGSGSGRPGKGAVAQ